MKSKNSSEKILNNIKSKGFKFIKLDSVIETNHIVERSGENFKRFVFSFNDQSGNVWQSVPFNAFRANYDENQNWVDDQNAELVFHDLNGARHVIASPSDFNI